MLAAVILCIAAVAAAGAVEEISDSNFDKYISDNEFVMVEFFAPWCGHCRALEPEYEKAAANLKGTCKLVKIDGSLNDVSASKYEVQGYPTLLLFKKGQVKEYHGQRDTAAITKWVKAKVKPDVTPLAGGAEITNLALNSNMAVGFFPEGSDMTAFETSAFTTEDVKFASVSSAAVAAEYGATPPAVVVMRKGGEGKSIYTGDLQDSAALSKFVWAHSLPMLVEYTSDMEATIFSPYAEHHLLILYQDQAAHPEVFAEAEKAAAAFRGKVVFVKVNVKEGGKDSSHQDLVDYFGVSKQELPRVVMFTVDNGEKFHFIEEVTEGDLTKFINGVLEGKQSPHLRSQAASSSQEGLVKTLVGSTYTAMVQDPTKDVLVEYYAPWCGHCKALAPIYEKVAEHFASDSSMVVAAIDATVNDVPGFEVEGFPTVIFWPKNYKQGVEYEGIRTKDDMVDWINGLRMGEAAKDEL